ncbi:MAG: glycosyltransferase family 2 protein [Phycisphaerae bacterium]
MSDPLAETIAVAPPQENVQSDRVLVVIVCYRVPDLTVDCLRSLESEVASMPGLRVAVCENGTGGESVQAIQEAIDTNGWGDWAVVTAIHPNRGFTGGNNVILREALAEPDPPEYFLLLNADTVVRPGAVEALLDAARQHPEAGIFSPRLEWPDGTPQVSCFLDRSPVYEFFQAASTGIIDRLLHARDGHLPVSDVPVQVEWTSFACALIRRAVFRDVGLLDEGYFLYFDDPDFCRRTRAAGWKVCHRPEARVVHLRGRSNPVKSLAAERKRRPSYWYESRARYYAKYYGRSGLWVANACWWLGRSISLARELLGAKRPHICRHEWLDIWMNSWRPVREPPQYPQT